MVTIKDDRKKKAKFGDLDIGDYFVYDGCLYTVVENAVIEDNVCDNYDAFDVMNALHLSDGGLTRFLRDDIVEPVDIKITIS